MAPRLRAVPSAESTPVDIYTEQRKRIEERDWSAVHIAGDLARALPTWFGRRR